MQRRNFLGSAGVFAAGLAAVEANAQSVTGGPNADAGAITEVPGVKVGHFTDTRRPTGCTVIITEAGAVGGVDVRGSAPGTRETDLLNPINLVDKVTAVMLAGGSAFGLDAATGVMRYLEERKLGYNVGVGFVPIVPAAILFDLGVGDPKIRPDASAGYKACEAASTARHATGRVAGRNRDHHRCHRHRCRVDQGAGAKDCTDGA